MTHSFVFFISGSKNTGNKNSLAQNIQSSSLFSSFSNSKSSQNQQDRYSRSSPPPPSTPQRQQYQQEQTQQQQQQQSQNKFQQAFGPFPQGRKGLVERSSLIRHASQKPQRFSPDLLRSQNNEKNIVNLENQSFLKDVRTGF